ncbi:hypothetical protein KL937_000236 [Ogataea polymorpha]|nr:hypothetical protein KL937_000236 [Ogataea polymorpha]KAG7895750.1 hypothetical protein KL936_000458 [Ogataea polymorpha]KAG7939299.1 hypothetical protein KL934_000233 [Ogataea polymorpha]KAG7940450.1 hypothetical protein KL904_000313 [Ogataea polymorpha]
MLVPREEIANAAGQQPAAVSFGELALPLPYKCLLLVTAGVWLWYLNLRVCYACKIDTVQVLKLSGTDNLRLVRESLNVAYKVSFTNLLNYSIYLLFVSNERYFTGLEYLPLLGILLTFGTLVWPSGTQSPGGKRFFETVRRICVGNIDIPHRNNDILLADTFTSYTKVLVDFLVYVTALALGYQTLPSPNIKQELTKDHLKIYNLDILLSMYPSLIRLKQCLHEYEQSRRRNKQHLLNAIKYSSAFLPLFANILIRSNMTGLGIWYLAVFINSCYTFFWDVHYDWNFELFMRFLSNKRGLPLLRHKLVYTSTFYYLAIFIDLQLRFVWVYRLLYADLLPYKEYSFVATILSSLYVNETGNFVLEILEIFRRWVWVFLKIETEYLKSATELDLELQSM